MTKTAIYMRVSTDKQVEQGESIPAQRDALRKYIDEKPDLVFVGEYLDDGISGTKDDRDELNRLLADVREGKIDLILVTKLDRLYRNIRHYLNLQDTLDKCNVNWRAIWEPIYDTATPQGRLIINQMMSIAQFEAENTGQRIRHVQSYKVSQGEVISGSTPPGYRIENKHLVPNEDAPLVKEAFETFAQCGSLYKTIQKYADCPVFPNSQCAFKQMLRNKKYIGEYRNNPQFCQPIIDRELFDMVQIQLSRNVKISQKRIYIFSGLLRCKECGGVMAGAFRSRQRGNCRQKYKYYRCSNCWNRPVRTCWNKKSINETVVERYMLENIKSKINDLIYTVEQQPVKDNRKKISSIHKKIDRLKDLYVNGLISLDEYKEDREQFQAEIEALSQPDIPKDYTELKKLLSADIETLYDTFTEEEKRFFWRSFIKGMTFDKNRSIDIIFL